MFSHIFQSPQGQRIALAPGAVFSYTARAGERLRCEGGRALLSQFRVDEDFDLGRGMEVTIRTHGLVVIEAIDPAVLTIARQMSAASDLRRYVRKLADDVFSRNKTPVAAVLAIVAVVAKHKVISGRH
jgi:hypothetical protein